MSSRTTRKRKALEPPKLGTALDEALAAQERAPVILAPDGTPAREIEARESEASIPATIHDFRAIVRRNFPLLTLSDQESMARKMLERHPFLERAFRDGLREGRDVRERVQRGLGLWWDSLAPLSPKERGYIVERVTSVIMKDVHN